MSNRQPVVKSSGNILEQQPAAQHLGKKVDTIQTTPHKIRNSKHASRWTTVSSSMRAAEVLVGSGSDGLTWLCWEGRTTAD